MGDNEGETADLIKVLSYLAAVKGNKQLVCLLYRSLLTAERLYFRISSGFVQYFRETFFWIGKCW